MTGRPDRRDRGASPRETARPSSPRAARPQPEPGPAGAEPRRALRRRADRRRSRASEILLLDRATATWETISVDVNGRPDGALRGPRRPAGHLVGRPLRRLHGRRPGRPARRHAEAEQPLPAGLPARSADGDHDPASRSARPARQGLGHSSTPAISGNGAVVAFASAAGDLVADDANQQDRRLRLVQLHRGRGDHLALDRRAPRGTPRAAFPAVNGDGRQVAFASGATTLVPGDTTGGPPAPHARISDFAAPPRQPARRSPATSSSAIAAPAAPRASRSGATTRARRTGSAPTRPSRRSGASSPSPPRPTTSSRRGEQGARRLRPRPPARASRRAPNPVDFGSAPLGSLGTTRPATIRSTGIGPRPDRGDHHRRRQRLGLRGGG